MIQLEHVTKRYGSKTIIHDISFDVKKGEIVGFLGPNGAGKTTTMRMIAGFTTASTGSVRVAGYDMATENNEAAKKIGYLPEQPPLYDVLDVSSYLRFVARAKGISSARIASELDRVMQACRLETVTTKEIYKLSKGYRQRVGLAQALLGDPDAGQVRANASGAPLERMVVDRLARLAVLAIEKLLGDQGSNHLGVAVVTTLRDVDVSAGNLQGGIRLNGVDRRNVASDQKHRHEFKGTCDQYGQCCHHRELDRKMFPSAVPIHPIEPIDFGGQIQHWDSGQWT